MNDTQQNTGITIGLRGYREDDKRGWNDETTDNGPTVFTNPAIGSVAVGMTPLGYDQPILHTNYGSPVLGYWFDEQGELYLTALIAGRWNLEEGTPLPEVAGGFASVDAETGEKSLPKSGALRELVEETGINLDDVDFADGAPFIGDRAFFWKAVGEGNNVFMFELKDEHLAHIRLSRQLELMHWTKFVCETVDGITLGAISRVMASLANSGVLKVTKA